jgi:hypothetical protein
LADSSRQVDVALNERETEQSQRLLGDPTVFPQIFKNWVTSWTEQDTSIALAQVQGWSDYLNQQTAKDSAQDTAIAANTTGVSSVSSDVAVANTNITALQNSDSSQNSTISNHTSSINTATSTNATQDTRLAALEAKPIPGLIVAKTTTTSVTSGGTAGEQATPLVTMTLPANKLGAPGGLCEMWVSGGWVSNDGTARNSPLFNVYFGTTLIANSIGLSTSILSATEFPFEISVRCMNTTDKSHQHITTTLVAETTIQSNASAIYHRRADTAVATTSNRDFIVKCILPVTSAGYIVYARAGALMLLG